MGSTCKVYVNLLVAFLQFIWVVFSISYVICGVWSPNTQILRLSLQVVPTRGSIPEVSFKVDWKRRLALASPRRSTAKPRAATALELIRICREVQSRFSEVDVPFLIVHGGDDIVCDPACAEELYKKAASKDKTIRIYPGMWHQLIGEPDENVELVFGEVVEWLTTRAKAAKSGGGEEAGTAVEVGGA